MIIPSSSHDGFPPCEGRAFYSGWEPSCERDALRVKRHSLVRDGCNQDRGLANPEAASGSSPHHPTYARDITTSCQLQTVSVVSGDQGGRLCDRLAAATEERRPRARRG